jgi:hypothetical protein
MTWMMQSLTQSMKHKPLALRAMRSGSALALFTLVVLAIPGPAWTQQAPVWPVKQRLLGKDGAKSTDVSGIACAAASGFPRSCLVIDDELQAAQFIVVTDGKLRAGDPVPLIDNRLGRKPLELDGEGVAYDDGAFYVIGSHGHPRDKKKELDPVADKDEIDAKIAASSQIVRVRMKPSGRGAFSRSDVAGVDRSSRLREFIVAEPALSRFMDRRLENNGVSIEGVAVLQGRLFAGFRGPSLDNGRAPVLSVSLAALFEGGPAQPKVHLLPLGNGQGVRDLASYEAGILILAGPSGDEAGSYIVYWWDAVSENVRRLADITKAVRASKDSKPEAILPLGRDASGLRVLILSDGAKEGKPRAVVIPSP